MFHIFLKMLTGKTITLDVEYSDTFEDVKNKLFTQESSPLQGLPIDKFRIILCGREVPGHRTLFDENVGMKTVLHLMLKKDATSDLRTEFSKASDDTLFADPHARVVWEMVYLNKSDRNADPFSREVASVVTADSLEEVLAGYQRRKQTGHKDRFPYIAATVMREDWKLGGHRFDSNERDKSSGGLPTYMTADFSAFDRPVLALYTVQPDPVTGTLGFVAISNPLYRSKPLMTISRMHFETVLASLSSGAASAVAVSAGAMDAADTHAVMPIASSESLNYMERRIADHLRDQLPGFAKEGNEIEFLRQGAQMAFVELQARYISGPVADGAAMSFAAHLSNELAQEICSAIAIDMDHASTPALMGVESLDQVRDSAVAYMTRLSRMNFAELLAYLEITNLMPSASMASGAAVSAVSADDSVGPAGAGSGVASAPSAPPAEFVVESVAPVVSEAIRRLVVLDVEGTIRDSGFDEETLESTLTYQNISGELLALRRLGCEIVLATGLREPALSELRGELEREGMGQYISCYQPLNASGSAEGESKAEKISAYLRQFETQGRPISPSNVYFYDDMPAMSSQALAAQALGVNLYSVNNLGSDGPSLKSCLETLVHELNAGAGAGAGTVVPSAPAVDAVAVVPGEMDLRTAFVVAFRAAYMSDVTSGVFGRFGSAFRNTDFLILLDRMSTPREKFEQIQSHFAESRATLETAKPAKPARTASVVRALLEKPEFSALVRDFSAD